MVDSYQLKRTTGRSVEEKNRSFSLARNQVGTLVVFARVGIVRMIGNESLDEFFPRGGQNDHIKNTIIVLNGAHTVDHGDAPTTCGQGKTGHERPRQDE
jgi:hypothetical protein